MDANAAFVLTMPALGGGPQSSPKRKTEIPEEPCISCIGENLEFQGAVCFLICNEEVVLLSTRGAGGLLIRMGLGRGDWVDKLEEAATACYSDVNRSAGLSRSLASGPSPCIVRGLRGPLSSALRKIKRTREACGVLGPSSRAEGSVLRKNAWK